MATRYNGLLHIINQHENKTVRINQNGEAYLINGNETLSDITDGLIGFSLLYPACFKTVL
jgi:hypothetical protein